MKNELIKIIRSAGTLARNGFYGSKKIGEKAPYDLVTDYDNEIETFIKTELTKIFPEASIYAEETGYSIKSGNHLFVIDPIDGTANFIFGVPYFAVSLAEIINDEIITAIVYNPVSDDLFYADSDSDASLNASKIKTSDRKDISESFVIFGFSANSSNISRYQREWAHIFDKPRKSMPLITPSLNLCSVAMGRADAYIDFNCSFEGQVAGAFILQKAGGKMTDYLEHGYDCRKKGIVATNGVLEI